jgi:hypothetical protein
MKTYTASCEICKKEIEANNPAQLARNLALHKRYQHGIAGKTSNYEGNKKMARYRMYLKRGADPVKAEAAYQARKALRPEATVPTIQRKPKHSDALPMALAQCPLCKARFYYAITVEEGQ